MADPASIVPDSCGSSVVWENMDRENHWRRTFCQIPFSSIYEQAEKGKKSLHGLVDFFHHKAEAERTASNALLYMLHEKMGNSLEDLEEYGTSIRKALFEVKNFVEGNCNQQLLLAKVLEEQIATPLISLQNASKMYVKTLQDEIKNVN
jgi:hypothetical protein